MRASKNYIETFVHVPISELKTMATLTYGKQSLATQYFSHEQKPHLSPATIDCSSLGTRTRNLRALGAVLSTTKSLID